MSMGEEEKFIKLHIGKEFVCPACGWECNKMNGLMINIGEDFDGEYCLRCWAKEMSKKIPKMVREGWRW